MLVICLYALRLHVFYDYVPSSSLRKGVHFVSINRLRLILPGFNAKLSDFGLAKYGPQDDQSHVSSRILGTKGYFAPEYIGTGIAIHET